MDYLYAPAPVPAPAGAGGCGCGCGLGLAALDPSAVVGGTFRFFGLGVPPVPPGAPAPEPGGRAPKPSRLRVDMGNFVLREFFKVKKETEDWEARVYGVKRGEGKELTDMLSRLGGASRRLHSARTGPVNERSRGLSPLQTVGQRKDSLERQTEHT